MSLTLTYGETSVVLPSPIYAKKPTATSERWQNKNVCGDGSVKIYDHDVTERWIELGFRVTTEAFGFLQIFMQETVVFSKEYFLMEPDANLDLGAGVGVRVYARFWQDTLPKSHDAPGFHEFKLLFRFDSFVVEI